MADIRQVFTQTFGESGEIREFFAPGRVNLIGEHTDYNGGHVFPCALSVGTYAVVRKRNDGLLKFYSINFPEKGIVESNLHGLQFEGGHDWANYPKGVVAAFIEAGFPIQTGFEIVFYGNIPNGAGLSSSASIELATAAILKGLYELEVDMVTMVKLAQKAENEFIGVNCGIMDQFAIGLGKKDHAILLDCQTLQYQYSEVPLDGYALIIANTNKRRGLADSKYNERRSECERGLKHLQTELAITSLGDITREKFDEYSYLITNEIDRKRCKHAVYENARTNDAASKLASGDISGFGRLMNESHISLRDDYEVTGKELDALVEAAWDQEAIGARMTGAGFGGCTVNLVKKEEVSTFIEVVGNRYEKETGLKAEFYPVEIGDGAREITSFYEEE
jgi:galactokinase